MSRIQTIFACGAGAVMLLAAVQSLSAEEINCKTMPHEVAMSNGFKLNQIHVFCGEYSNSRPKGFHSRPAGNNPSTVKSFTIQDGPNAAGIYTGKWIYEGTTRSKFSSMFPDNCSKEQVIASIAHASAHVQPCPAAAPDWAQCGKNLPDDQEADKSAYCSKDGRDFFIAFAPPRNSVINTAFPIR